MRVRYLILAASAVCLTGCDTFYEVHGNVTDYSTGRPIAGARAKLVLDRGVEEPDHIALTDDSGRLDFIMNEPRGVWATLTVEHTNYSRWSAQFRGTPDSEIGVRLVPKGQP
jgi:hypothetical protein